MVNLSVKIDFKNYFTRKFFIFYFSNTFLHIFKQTDNNNRSFYHIKRAVYIAI